MRRAIAGVGRTLVTLGLLILMFVAYQLWGTGVFTARAQSQLKKDFAKEQQAYAEQDTVAASPTTTNSPSHVGSTTSTTFGAHRTTSTTELTRKPPPTPGDGQVEGNIRIPKIGLNMDFVEGVTRDDLKKGPGHYPDTPLPGTIGNAAIAGHRTTYLHPFYDTDKLKPGDKILVTTLEGLFTYSVIWQQKVAPTDVAVVDNTLDPELTLTTCNPKYSAAQRLVTRAVLVRNESAKPRKAAPPKTKRGGSGKSHGAQLEEWLSGQDRSKTPAVLWGLLAALVGGLWWWSFRRWRHPGTWLLGVLPFLAALLPFYVFLERALPAGY